MDLVLMTEDGSSVSSSSVAVAFGFAVVGEPLAEMLLTAGAFVVFGLVGAADVFGDGFAVGSVSPGPRVEYPATGPLNVGSIV
jgi:hypothetical protein